MAKLLTSSFTNSLILVLMVSLFLRSTEIPMADARLCEKRSQTWTGFCGSSSNCNKQCRSWERASHGACHAQFLGFACFCYFNC